MIHFPPLSRAVSLGGLSETKAADPTIRSRFESGAVLTRARFTKAKKAWEVIYNFLTAADKTMLLSFEDELNIGAATFNWVEPKSRKTYECRLAAPVKFKLEPRHPDLWEAQLQIIEA